MKNKKFLIPTLLAAGFIPLTELDANTDTNDGSNFENDPVIGKRLELEHSYTLAAHRSHSSHRSHRSSSGSGYAPSRRVAPRAITPTIPRNFISPQRQRSNSTPPASILPGLPKSKPKTLPGNSEKFFAIARRVQLALQAYGYYTGSIDGLIGKGSKTALASFQKDYGLNVTGTITPEVLNAFGIQAR